MITLKALYPQPTDAAKFEADYAEHVKLLHEKTGIPLSERPYTITKFLPSPDGSAPPFYQMFSMPFESVEAFQATMADAGFQEVAADAVRISSGGAPVMMAGDES
ncbi:MAG: EthD family reductase [Cyclobacteriaceae bacterium]